MRFDVKSNVEKIIEQGGVSVSPVGLAQEAGGKIVEAAKKAGEVVTAPFDFIVWIKDNWQLAVVGAVAILVLIRD